MNCPYSRISTVRVLKDKEVFLLAVAGPRLFVANLASGALVSAWTAPRRENTSRATKRQKIVPHLNGKATQSEPEGRRNLIIDLATVPVGGYIAVITEDKAIHVLLLEEKGGLVESSHRTMPKRPCAVQILSEEKVILCADKFGDVYSLPLFPESIEDTRYVKCDGMVGQSENQKPPTKEPQTKEQQPLEQHSTQQSKEQQTKEQHSTQQPKEQQTTNQHSTQQLKEKHSTQQSMEQQSKEQHSTQQPKEQPSTEQNTKVQQTKNQQTDEKQPHGEQTQHTKDPEGQGDEHKFKPAASTLTVHTKRNLRALESQENQKFFTARKKELLFDHDLILGHVSLLTDMAYIKLPKSSARIITVDRDEHIRVSRAPPEAHVIEGFCLGHEAFINKLCPIPGTTFIATAGGDDWVGVWNWQTLKSKHKINLKPAILNAAIDIPDENGHLAISQMKYIQTGHHCGALLIISEKMKGIITITLDKGQKPRVHAQATEQAPLDITGVGHRVCISFDVRTFTGTPLQECTVSVTDGVTVLQKAGGYTAPQQQVVPRQQETGTTERRTPAQMREMASKVAGKMMEKRYKDLAAVVLEESTSRMTEVVQKLNAQSTALLEGKVIDSLLYGVANLRKRAGWAGVEAEAEEEAEAREDDEE